MGIQLLNIKKKFDSNRDFQLGLLNLTLKLEEISLIKGNNGSGKSTLLSCIAGYLRPDSGYINFSDKLNQRDVVYMFQNFRTMSLPWMKCNDFLRLGNSISEDDIPDSIHGLNGKLLSNLSGGQLQSIILIKAVCSKAKIIILDEPFSNLDSNIIKFFVKIIEKKVEENKTTFVIATHNNSIEFKNCRHFYLQKGKVVHNA